MIYKVIKGSECICVFKDKYSCYYDFYFYDASGFLSLLSSAERCLISLCGFAGFVKGVRSFRRYMFCLLIERTIESGF